MASGEGNSVSIQEKPTDNKRLNNLNQFFQLKFGTLPDFFIRVPGRVNLIGEHIDYCGYGVCPMALQQDMLLAVSKGDSAKVTLINTNEKYKKQILDTKFEECTAPEWHQYFLCGVKGVQEVFGDHAELQGMNVVADGNIPPRAGLSSSSALVSAAALCTYYTQGIVPTKEEIADLCAKAERYIGTQGGGMDQAIAFLATKGCAKFIEFNPLRAINVKLPEGAVFVIAHSLVEKNKAASNDFNCRVVECRLAAQVIAKLKALPWPEVKKLSDLQNMLGMDLADMILLVERLLPKDCYEKSEIALMLDVGEKEIDEFSLTENTRDLEVFKLKQRALHVFREAERVRQFKAVCEKSSSGEALTALGKLMYESHESLRDLYEASHPQLDKIVEISRRFTFGCRLTGAGWGGCTVALVSPDRINEYIDALKKEYYTGLGVTDSELGSFVFSTAPHSGACIYQ